MLWYTREASVAVYVANVTAYSALLKHIVIADVVSLSLGFVLRVLVGCAAVGVSPTTWLLNTTFFLAMFLAFGKRLGERRLLGGEGAALARGVQAGYTDELLRLAVVVTAVVSYNNEVVVVSGVGRKRGQLKTLTKKKIGRKLRNRLKIVGKADCIRH